MKQSFSHWLVIFADLAVSFFSSSSSVCHTLDGDAVRVL